MASTPKGAAGAPRDGTRSLARWRVVWAAIERHHGGGMASRIEWDQVKPAVVRTELFELAVALVLMSLGWLSLPTLLLAVAAELVVTVALTYAVYPERGLRRHLLDVAKMLALTTFLAVFILAAYAGARGFDDGVLPDAREWIGVPALVALRCLMALREARAARDPRLQWSRSALMRGGALVVGTVLSAFTCFLGGVLLAGLLAPWFPERAADLAVGGVYLVTTGVIACILSTMSEHELAEISRQPYVD
jgi:hypothetical protein